MEKIEHFIQSHRGRKIILGVGIALIAILIFHAGVVVGMHRHARGEFGVSRGPGGFFIARMPHGFIEDGHGAVGVINSVTKTSFKLQGRDGSVQTVLISDTTVVRSFDGDASTSALKKGARVIVLGAPDYNGDISAHLVQIVPDSMPFPQQ